MKTKLLLPFILAGFISTTYANECLNKLLPDFKKNNISITRISKSGKITLGATDDSNQKCETYPSELEQFVTKNFQTKTTIDGMDIIQSWNYLSINKHVIYDGTKDILDRFQGTDENQKNYWLDIKSSGETSSYELVSIVNDNMVCYSDKYSSDIGAHPSNDGDYVCRNINDDKIYKITDLFNEAELLKKLLANNDLRNIVKNPRKLSSIKTLANLNDLVNDMSSNEEGSDTDKYNLECMQDSFNPDNIQFIVTKFNNDTTVNISYRLTHIASTTQAEVCDGEFDTIELSNLHPKVKITKLLTTESLNTISKK